MTANDIRDMQSLAPDEQVIIFSLVRSFMKGREQQTDAQKWFAEERSRMVKENPMSMEEIDRIIHESA